MNSDILHVLLISTMDTHMNDTGQTGKEKNKRPKLHKCSEQMKFSVIKPQTEETMHFCFCLLYGLYLYVLSSKKLGEVSQEVPMVNELALSLILPFLGIHVIGEHHGLGKYKLLTFQNDVM